MNLFLILMLKKSVFFLCKIKTPCFLFSFFCLGFFLSRTFTIHRTAGEGRGYLVNSTLPLPPTSLALRHQPGDYCRELTSAHSQQPDSNPELSVFKRKSLTTKLRTGLSLGTFQYVLLKINFFSCNRRNQNSLMSQLC